MKSNQEPGRRSDTFDRIATALERIADALESRDEAILTDYSRIDRTIQARNSEVPTKIRDATAEEIAAEIVSFIHNEFPDDDRIGYTAVSLFWEQMNVGKYALPPDLKIKVQKAELLAARTIGLEREGRKKEQLEKEKQSLPGLVNEAVHWARENTLKRITLSDVEAFLLEKRLEILPQTKKSLYAAANVAIKRQHPEVSAALRDQGADASSFMPIDIKGEPLSTTILRERR